MSKEVLTEELEVYRVWFFDPSDQRRYTDVPRRKGIAEVFNGIWVDADWEYGCGDVVHWIPASRYIVVSKLDKLEQV